MCAQKTVNVPCLLPPPWSTRRATANPRRICTWHTNSFLICSGTRQSSSEDPAGERMCKLESSQTHRQISVRCTRYMATSIIQLYAKNMNKIRIYTKATVLNLSIEPEGSLKFTDVQAGQSHPAGQRLLPGQAGQSHPAHHEPPAQCHPT